MCSSDDEDEMVAASGLPEDEIPGTTVGSTNGKVRKHLLSAGDMKQGHPPVLSRCVVYIQGTAPDGTVFVSHTTEEVDFLVGQARMPTGVEMAIVGMYPGERAVIICEEGFGYNNIRRPASLAKDCFPLRFDVTLLRWEKEDNVQDMSVPDRFEYVRQRRVVGNRLFKEGKPLSAAKQYERALLVIEDGLGGQKGMELKKSRMPTIESRAVLSREMEAEKASMIENSLLNLSACHYSVQDWVQTIRYCTKVLTLNPHNLKALYRRARASMQRDELVQARADLEKFQTLCGEADSKMRALGIQQLTRLQKLERAFTRDQRKKYANVFNNKTLEGLYKDKPAPQPAAPKLEQTFAQRQRSTPTASLDSDLPEYPSFRQVLGLMATDCCGWLKRLQHEAQVLLNTWNQSKESDNSKPKQQ